MDVNVVSKNTQTLMTNTEMLTSGSVKITSVMFCPTNSSLQRYFTAAAAGVFMQVSFYNFHHQFQIKQRISSKYY